MTQRAAPPPARPLLRRLMADERGAALVEFAFVLPPLLIILMGGMDLGYELYLRAVVQAALTDIARSGTLETINVSCTGTTNEEILACALRERTDVIARRATYDIEMTNFYDFSTVGRSERLVTDYNHNGQYNTGDCFVDLNANNQWDADAGRDGRGGADDVVFYEVTLSAPRLFPVQEMLGFDDEYHIVAQTAVRNQPYAQQNTPPTVCV